MPATTGTKRKAEEDSGTSSGEDVKVDSVDATGGANQKLHVKKKRSTVEPNKNEGASTSTRPTATDAPLQLPAVVWGNVLNFMPYEDVRSTLLVGKLIAVEAAKYVQALHIMKSTQMVGPLARRFPNVTDINIFCLLIHKVAETAQEFDSDGRFCSDTAVRTVPFVSMFSKLKRIFVGGRNIFPAAYDYREDMWFPARPMRI